MGESLLLQPVTANSPTPQPEGPELPPAKTQTVRATVNAEFGIPLGYVGSTEPPISTGAKQNGHFAVGYYGAAGVGLNFPGSRLGFFRNFHLDINGFYRYLILQRSGSEGIDSSGGLSLGASYAFRNDSIRLGLVVFAGSRSLKAGGDPDGNGIPSPGLQFYGNAGPRDVNFRGAFAGGGLRISGPWNVAALQFTVETTRNVKVFSLGGIPQGIWQTPLYLASWIVNPGSLIHNLGRNHRKENSARSTAIENINSRGPIAVEQTSEVKKAAQSAWHEITDNPKTSSTKTEELNEKVTNAENALDKLKESIRKFPYRIKDKPVETEALENGKNQALQAEANLQEAMNYGRAFAIYQQGLKLSTNAPDQENIEALQNLLDSIDQPTADHNPKKDAPWIANEELRQDLKGKVKSLLDAAKEKKAENEKKATSRTVSANPTQPATVQKPKKKR